MVYYKTEKTERGSKYPDKVVKYSEDGKILSVSYFKNKSEAEESARRRGQNYRD